MTNPRRNESPSIRTPFGIRRARGRCGDRVEKQSRARTARRRSVRVRARPGAHPGLTSTGKEVGGGRGPIRFKRITRRPPECAGHPPIRGTPRESGDPPGGHASGRGGTVGDRRGRGSTERVDVLVVDRGIRAGRHPADVGRHTRDRRGDGRGWGCVDRCRSTKVHANHANAGATIASLKENFEWMKQPTK